MQFETEEQANRANYEVDGTSLMGKYIKVEKFSSQQRMKSMHAKTKGTNLFVKNFGDKLGDDNLFSMFEVSYFCKYINCYTIYIQIYLLNYIFNFYTNLNNCI